MKTQSFVGRFFTACLLLALLPASLVLGQTATQPFITAGTGQTWVVPAGVTAVQVEAWGSGGGGGNSNNGTTNGGSGGGGGAYSRSIITVVPGNTYYIQVGAFGTGGPASSTTAPSAGGDAWFNSTNIAPTSIAGVLAKGGGAGANNSTAVPTNGGSAASGWGNFTFSGGNGGAGSNASGGGGGSSAGNAANGAVGGNAGNTNSEGLGGVAPTGGGNGGKGGGSTVPADGTAPGGGGGGSDDVASQAGRAGALGKVVITYPTITISSYSASPVCQGASFTISGTNFTGVTSVTVNGVSCSFVVSSSILLTVTMAPTATTGLVAVSNSAGTVTGSSIAVDGNTVTAPSSTPTLCINSLLTNITHTTTGATGISNDGVSGANGLPAGVSASWSANVITVSGTPTAAGTFNYSIPLTGGCGTVSATGTITVTQNTAGAASSIETVCVNNILTNITHTTTGATGISNNGVSGANGLPAGVSASWADNVITISGTPTGAGTFNYSIPLTGGCGSVVNATGTITVITAIPVNPISIATAQNTCPGYGIPVTVFSSTLTSGTYTVTYDVNNGGGNCGGGSWLTNTATMVFDQSTGKGSFTTLNITGNCAYVTIKNIAVGSCNLATPINIVTNSITNGAPSASFTLTASTADSNSPFGATINIIAKGNGFSAGTYQISYTITPGAISGTAVVNFTNRKGVQYNGSFTTGQLAAGTYTIDVTNVSYYPSTSCASFDPNSQTTFTILPGGTTVKTKGNGDGSGSYCNPSIWANSLTSFPDYNSSIIEISANDLVQIDGNTLYNSPDILQLDQLVIYGTLQINSFEILQILDGAGLDIQIASGGQLIIMPSGTNPGGTLIFTGDVTHAGTSASNVTFNAGSIYRHWATTTEGAPPLAAWNATSTVYVEGYTNYSTAFNSANWSQNFGNFTWNCANQTSDVNLNSLLGLTPATTGNIQGDITIQSTGSGILRFGLVTNHYLTTPKDFITSNAARFAFADNSGNGPDVALSVKDFTYGSTASSWLCDRGKNTVNVSGNFTVNSGILYLSSGANTKTGSDVKISGNMTVAGSLDASDTNNDKQGKISFVNLASPGEHLFTNTGTIQGHVLWTIAANQIVRAKDNSPFVSANTTSAAFTLTAGAKLIVESTDANGAIQPFANSAGNIRIPDTGRTFQSGASIEYSRTPVAAQFISGSGHPTASGVNCIINNGSGVTVTSAGTITIGGDLTISNGNLHVTNSNLTIQQATNTTGGNLVFNTSSFDATPQSSFRTVTFTGTLNMTGGQVQVTSGALDASNAILQINGGFAGANVFTFAGNNCRVLVGSTAPLSMTFPIGVETSLEQLTINRPGVTFSVNKKLNLGNYPDNPTTGLTLTSGNLDMNADLLITADAILTNGTLFFDAVSGTINVEMRRNIVTSATGLLYSNTNSTLSVTSDFQGTPADNLTFASGGNTIGTLTINRSYNFASQANVELSSSLTITNTLHLKDGQFYAPAGLSMASGATIIRTPQSEFFTGSAVPGGGPYHLIYNNYLNPADGGSLQMTNITTSLEIQGSLNNVTSNLSGTGTVASAFTGIGTLTINSGIFDCVNFAVAMNSVAIANTATLNAPIDNTLTLTGNFANDGTFNSAYNLGSGNSSVIFNGTSTISGSSTTEFNFLTLNTTKTLTGPALMRVKRDINFGSGSIYNNSKGTIELNGSVNQNITANNTVGAQNLSMADDAFMLTTMHLYSLTVNKSGGLVNLNQGGSDPQLRLGHLLDIQSATNVVSQGKLLLLSQNKSTYLDASIGPILNGGTVTGDVEVQRFMGETVHALFRYIASPVQVGAIPSVVNKIYRYNTPTATWVWDFNNMSTGMGYTTLTYNPINSRWSVKDDIHIGSFTYPAFPVNGWYLIGNPYASAIQWRNPDNVIDPTDGWDMDVSKVSSIMAITDNNIAGYPNYFHYYDYASVTNPGWGTSPVAGSGTIAMGQAFWVYGLAGGIITVKEPAKKSATTLAEAGQFYRKRSQQVSEQLAISINNGKMRDQTFLILNPTATESFDFNLDFPKLWNMEMNVYLANKSNESMLMLAWSDIPQDSKIPVGVKVTEPGEYELSFSNSSAFNHTLYLIDLYEGEAIPVSEGQPYKITIKDTSRPINDRFYLSSRAEIQIGKDALVSVYPNPVTDWLNIQIRGQKYPSPVSIYDINGRLLKSAEIKKEGSINVADFKGGIYILKVQTEQGIFVQKIVKE